MAGVRDRVAQRLANAALSLATPRYRALIKGSIRYGMAASARDTETGVPAPADWAEDSWWKAPNSGPLPAGMLR